jgi:hypothetical protein
LHANTSVVAHYDSDDMRLFDKILDDILSELSDQRSPLTEPKHEDTVRTLLAIALLKCAESGERDYDRLKRAALAAIGEGGPGQPPRH